MTQITGREGRPTQPRQKGDKDGLSPQHGLKPGLCAQGGGQWALPGEKHPLPQLLVALLLSHLPQARAPTVLVPEGGLTAPSR